MERSNRGQGEGRVQKNSGDHRGRSPLKRRSDPFKWDLGLLSEHPSEQGAEARVLAGVDEAGRGCLAGPLVTAGVILDYGRAPFRELKGITDSKLLSREAREALYPKVLRSALRVSLAVVSPLTIDDVGLHHCNLIALTRCLEIFAGEYDLAVVDAFDLKRPDLKAVPVIAADFKSAAVAAASVVAKVVRDRLMRSLDGQYPEYGFAEHVGYATEMHRDALRRFGPCRLHRLSFQGVATPQLELWDGESPFAPGE